MDHDFDGALTSTKAVKVNEHQRHTDVVFIMGTRRGAVLQIVLPLSCKDLGNPCATNDQSVPGHRRGVRCCGTSLNSSTRSLASTRQPPPTRSKRLRQTSSSRDVLRNNLPL
jgi:hypothetical protein